VKRTLIVVSLLVTLGTFAGVRADEPKPDAKPEAKKDEKKPDAKDAKKDDKKKPDDAKKDEKKPDDAKKADDKKAAEKKPDAAPAVAGSAIAGAALEAASPAFAAKCDKHKFDAKAKKGAKKVSLVFGPIAGDVNDETLVAKAFAKSSVAGIASGVPWYRVLGSVNVLPVPGDEAAGVAFVALQLVNIESHQVEVATFEPVFFSKSKVVAASSGEAKDIESKLSKTSFGPREVGRIADSFASKLGSAKLGAGRPGVKPVELKDESDSKHEMAIIQGALLAAAVESSAKATWLVPAANENGLEAPEDPAHKDDPHPAKNKAVAAKYEIRGALKGKGNRLTAEAELYELKDKSSVFSVSLDLSTR
jgi:hypothetical protein